MSSIQLCAAHQATSGFDGDAIAQYMRTDFITLQEHFSVHEAREHFISQLASDDIPGQVFVVAGNKLRGSLSVKKLLQEAEVGQSIRYLMDSCLFRVKPDDERPQVIAELTERGLDLVPVVDKGELVGCLMEKDIAHLLEDDVTEDAQLQGATLPLEKPYLEISPWTLWKKRSVWLLLLFVAEAYTSSVLQHFEEALESAMALGEVRLRDMGRVIRKEVSTSFLIALTLGLAGCLRAWMMGIGMEITLIVSLTLVCITLWSAVVSSVIPMLLKRIGIDPAVVSAPFIATLIDGTGLIIYFKIAQYFLGLN
ncbi:TPA: magnesium transporter [Klebsiella aerogenes]|nr:magnesium transporter [Klebsiella aerogenes]